MYNDIRSLQVIHYLDQADDKFLYLGYCIIAIENELCR